MAPWRDSYRGNILIRCKQNAANNNENAEKEYQNKRYPVAEISNSENATLNEPTKRESPNGEAQNASLTDRKKWNFDNSTYCLKTTGTVQNNVNLESD